MQLNFPIIDPHLHQWNPYTTPHAAAAAVKLFGRYPKLLDRIVRLVQPKSIIDTIGQTQHLTAPYLPINYHQDCGEYRVSQVVHVEASWHDHRPFAAVDETRFIQSLNFAEYGIELAALVVAADPQAPHFAELLKRHLDQSDRVRGIRKMAAHHPDSGVYNWTAQAHLYCDSYFLKGFEHLAQFQLSFDAWVYSHQIRDVIQLAQRFPETKIVIDHLATPVGLFGDVGKRTGRTEQEREYIFKTWQADFAALAECPNVSAKMSGLFMPVLGHQFYKHQSHANHTEVIQLTSSLIHHALDCFGPHRVMFASNFPMDSVNVHLDTLIDGFSDIVYQYHPDAVHAVFHDTAQRFYRL